MLNFVPYYMAMIQIKVINKGHQQLPAYATSQSAGMDLRANIDAPIVLQPMERRLIPTGLHIALPVGFEAQVRPRSGLALKHGLTVLNSPGTIDADYRGESWYYSLTSQMNLLPSMMVNALRRWSLHVTNKQSLLR